MVIIGESSKAINAFIEMGLGYKLTLVLTKSTHFKCQQTDIYVCLCIGLPPSFLLHTVTHTHTNCLRKC